MALNQSNRSALKLRERKFLVMAILLGFGSFGSEGALAANALTSPPTRAATKHPIPLNTALATEFGIVDRASLSAAENRPIPAQRSKTFKEAAITSPVSVLSIFAEIEEPPPFASDASAPPNLAEFEDENFAEDASTLGDIFIGAEFSHTDIIDSSILNAEVPSSPNDSSQTNANPDEIPWRFVLEPYVYLPLETNGDVTVRNVEVPYEFSLGDILETLTFAFYGRFEAWKGPWALVFDSYYFDTVESESRNIPAAALPPGLLPPQITQVPIEGTAETAFLKLDFAGAYRFGDGNLPNALSTAETEFDLGPLVFDAIAGIRLYSFSNDIELSTPLGFQRDFSRSNTFIEPMIGGRARWNFADNMAAIAAANLSGFGIGTDISVEGYAGVDWLFSGNTSLTATYRLTYIDYSEGGSGFNLFQHGPALGVKFRF